MTEQKAEQLKNVLSDKEFTLSLLEMESAEEVQAAIKAKGVDVDVEDIIEIRDALQKQSEGEGEELSEDQLDNVAGGFGIMAAIGVAAVIGASAGAAVTIGNGVHRWTRGRW